MQMEGAQTTLRISWSAIIVAAIIGVGLNFLLNLLSLSIGLSAFAYKSADQIAFSFMGFSGFLLVAIISMLSTGWIAGLIAGFNANLKLNWGVLHGFAAWCLLLMLTTTLITNMLQFATFHNIFTNKPNMVAIRITNDAPMLAEVKTEPSQKAAAIADVSKKTITLEAFVTFLLFLVGAISSCLGGHWGYAKGSKWKQSLLH